MPDKFTDRARKAAEEIVKEASRVYCVHICEVYIQEYTKIIERHMREWIEEKNRDAEKSRQFNESEIRRFEENHKEAAPCPKK